MKPQEIKVISVTPDEVTKIISGLQADGMAITVLDEGEYSINGHGVAATAVYTPFNDTVSGVLIVTVTKKPFYVSLARIESGLNGFIDRDIKA